LQEQGPLAGRAANAPYQWFAVRGDTTHLPNTAIVDKYGGKNYMLLSNQAAHMMVHTAEDNWSLSRAFRSSNNLGQPAVGFTFDPRGARRMGQLTSAHKDQPMAIVLDGEVYSAPYIRATIYDSGIIEGQFSPQDVDDLIKILNAGSLQAQVNEHPISQKTIAPSMGEDNRKAGLRAAQYSLVAIVVFMFGYYLLAGCIADLAVMLNLLLTLGTMSFLEAVFTMPGIAGVVLALGMAVDANVLIYERLREEQAKTQSMRMAVRNAYHHAFSAIFDGHVTTLITCMILGWVGTEEVRGFAITLGLGVLFSLFTAFFLTRWIFQILVDRNLLTKKVRMLHFLGVPNIDWMGKRFLFWSISLVLLVVGMVALFHQGTSILGLEFSSGTQASFVLQPGKMVPDGRGGMVLPDRPTIERDLQAKAIELAKQAAGDPARADMLTRMSQTFKIETLLDPDAGSKLMQQFDPNRTGKITQEQWIKGGGDKAFFAIADTNHDGAIDPSEADAITASSSNPHSNSYQVSTTVANLETLQSVVASAFGDRLQSRGQTTGRFQTGGPVEALGIDLPPDLPANAPAVPITKELAQQIKPHMPSGSLDDATVRARFTDYAGGAMMVLTEINPPANPAELAGRLDDLRRQQGFEDVRGDRAAIIGLASQGSGFSSVAILVADPTKQRTGDDWTRMVTGEQNLMSEAMKRSQNMDSSEFSASVAGETTQLAVIATCLAWLSIVVYLWIRFGTARWGVAAVVCLIHDVLVALGMVAATAYIYDTPLGKALLITEPFKVDMPMIAALLTIIGYSVNDTIVVFDRIRENRGRLRIVDGTMINHAINQTLARTLLTSLTVLIVLVVLYIFGGAGMRPFAFVLLVGVIVGTYSSIAIASPLLLGARKLLGLERQAAPAAQTTGK
jgi:SecD/SecF fusion protein